jgi:hypothetical protein
VFSDQNYLPGSALWKPSFPFWKIMLPRGQAKCNQRQASRRMYQIHQVLALSRLFIDAKGSQRDWDEQYKKKCEEPRLGRRTWEGHAVISNKLGQGWRGCQTWFKTRLTWLHSANGPAHPMRPGCRAKRGLQSRNERLHGYEVNGQPKNGRNEDRGQWHFSVVNPRARSQKLDPLSP